MSSKFIRNIKNLMICWLCLLIILPVHNPIQSATEQRVVYLYYMVGANLSAYASEQIDQMIDSLGQSESRNIFVFRVGGANDWSTEKIALPEGVNTDFVVTSGGEGEANIEMGNHASASMGTSSQLASFISSNILKYNDGNTRFHLVLWDHGGGPNDGFGVDYLFGHDGLTSQELSSAFAEAYEATQTKLGVIYFQACLMGNIEIAQIVAPYANYMVASEDLSYGGFTEPDAMLSETITDQELGMAWLESYKNYVTANQLAIYMSHVLLDLSKVPQLAVEIGKLGQRMEQTMTQDLWLRNILIQRNAIKTVGDDSTGRYFRDLVDIGSLVQEFTQAYPAESENIQIALNQAVVGLVKNESALDIHGVSLYFPNPMAHSIQSGIRKYSSVEFNPMWKQFVNAFGIKSAELNQLEYTVNSGEMATDAKGFVTLKIDPSELKNIQSVNYFVGRENANREILIEQTYKAILSNETQTYSSSLNKRFGFSIENKPVVTRFVKEDKDKEYYQLQLSGNMVGQVVVNKINQAIDPIQLKKEDYDGIPSNNLVVKGNVTLQTAEEWYQWKNKFDVTFMSQEIVLQAVPQISIRTITPTVEGYMVKTLSGHEIWYFKQGNGYTRLQLPRAIENGLNIQDWAQESIEHALQRGMIQSLYIRDYNKPVNRSQVAKMLVKLYEYTTGQQVNPPSGKIFEDTIDAEIIKAYSLGFIKGSISGGKRYFKGTELITRQDLAVMMVNYMERTYSNFELDPNGIPNGIDVRRVASYAKSSIACLQSKDILRGITRMDSTGKSQMYIDPLGNASIQQTIVILDRIYLSFQGEPALKQTVKVAQQLPSMMNFANYKNGVVSITNTDSVPISLKGCYIKADLFENKYYFPGDFVLPVGKTIYLLTGSSAKTHPLTADTYLWTELTLFSKAQNSYTATLYNENHLKIGEVFRQIILEAK